MTVEVSVTTTDTVRHRLDSNLSLIGRLLSKEGSTTPPTFVGFA